MKQFGYLLAFTWGAGIAVFMRASKLGRFMAKNMMWFIVATGAGVDLLLIRYVIADDKANTENATVRWLDVVHTFFWSSLVIAAWSIKDLSGLVMGAIDGLTAKK